MELSELLDFSLGIIVLGAGISIMIAVLIIGLGGMSVVLTELSTTYDSPENVEDVSNERWSISTEIVNAEQIQSESVVDISDYNDEEQELLRETIVNDGEETFQFDEEQEDIQFDMTGANKTQTIMIDGTPFFVVIEHEQYPETEKSDVELFNISPVDPLVYLGGGSVVIGVLILIGGAGSKMLKSF